VTGDLAMWCQACLTPQLPGCKVSLTYRRAHDVFAQCAPRQRRFLLVTFGILELFFVSMAASMYLFGAHRPAGALLYAITTVLGLLLLASVGMLVRWVAVGMDEFQRSVLIRALLWGLAAACAICGVWMVLERTLEVRHMPILAIPLVFLFSSLAAKLVIKFDYR
jgi:hypothetical protein